MNGNINKTKVAAFENCWVQDQFIFLPKSSEKVKVTESSMMEAVDLTREVPTKLLVELATRTC